MTKQEYKFKKTNALINIPKEFHEYILELTEDASEGYDHEVTYEETLETLEYYIKQLKKPLEKFSKRILADFD